MENKIQHYRQPMVTVTGIFLGFVLNFASHWVTTAFESDRAKDLIIGFCLSFCITLLLIVLYRILNMNYPKDKEAAYYNKTLVLFISGISIAFLAIIGVMVESYMIRI